MVDTVIEHLELEARVGGYAAADAVAERSSAVYASVAALVGASPDEIALVENATRAWDMAFYALACVVRARRPHPHVARRVREQRDRAAAGGARAPARASRWSPTTSPGSSRSTRCATMLDDRVRLVAMSWIPTQGGLVNPAAAVGAVTRAAGVPYLLDACQAVGQLPVDVDALGCDFLSATGRKYLRAPAGHRVPLRAARRGSSGSSRRSSTCTRRSGRPATGVVVRDDARRFESWEHSVANRLGLGAAVDDALALGVDAIAARVHRARRRRCARSSPTVPGLTLHDRGVERCGIVTFTIDGVDVYELAARLRDEGINISVSTIDFARYDFEARGLERRRARVGALLQHRRRAHASGRRRHCRARRRVERRLSLRPTARRAAATTDARPRAPATSSSPPAPATTTGLRVARRERRDAPRGWRRRSCARAPSPRRCSLSLAITHGCTRYGTTPGGTSPSPSSHVRASTRSSTSAGNDGHAATAGSARAPRRRRASRRPRR